MVLISMIWLILVAMVFLVIAKISGHLVISVINFNRFEYSLMNFVDRSQI